MYHQLNLVIRVVKSFKNGYIIILFFHYVTHFVKSTLDISSQQTRDIEPMLALCWADVYDVGPTLSQHWLNASCLLGCRVNYKPHKYLQIALSDYM